MVSPRLLIVLALGALAPGAVPELTGALVWPPASAWTWDRAGFEGQAPAFVAAGLAGSRPAQPAGLPGGFADRIAAQTLWPVCAWRERVYAPPRIGCCGGGTDHVGPGRKLAARAVAPRSSPWSGACEAGRSAPFESRTDAAGPLAAAHVSGLPRARSDFVTRTRAEADPVRRATRALLPAWDRVGSFGLENGAGNDGPRPPAVPPDPGNARWRHDRVDRGAELADGLTLAGVPFSWLAWMLALLGFGGIAASGLRAGRDAGP